jgi:thiamine pyrophosphate-dependent acetolactate synthase large subunit-like protein
VARRRVSSGVLDAAAYDARRDANEADRAAFEAASTVDGEAWDGPGVHPGRLIGTLNEVLPPQAIVTTDAGNFSGWAGRGYRFRQTGRRSARRPARWAMDCRPRSPRRSSIPAGRSSPWPVTARFAMTMSELETAVREGARPIVIVFDNQRYRTIRVHQDSRGSGAGRRPISARWTSRPSPRTGRPRRARRRRRGVRDRRSAMPRAAEAPTVIQVTLDRRWKAVGRLDPA